MIDRNTFESWPSKKQKSYALRMYPIVRKKVMEAFREEGLHRDRTGNVRDVCHHCWESKSGHSTPWWYYFQEDNLLPWSDSMHKTYHDVSKDKWTPEQVWEAEIAEKVKQSMIHDHKTYLANRINSVSESEFQTIRQMLNEIDEKL